MIGVWAADLFILCIKTYDFISKYLGINFGAYEYGWYQFGITIGYHTHTEILAMWHLHLWIDILKWNIEIRIGESL